MVRRVELEVKSLPYKFDISKISKQDAREIGFGWHKLLEDFYLDPENERKFQEWLKKKHDMENFA